MNKKYFRALWYALSSNQRYLVRRLYYLPADLIDKIKGNTHKYVPPRGYIYTGSAANAKKFVKQSQHQLEQLKTKINLKPDDAVLDIGSGIGRTAIALTDYLNSMGSYEGFDVVKRGVDWCKSTIQKENSNFNFTYVPLFNDLYNQSKLKAEDFVFPYQDNAFDKICSFSVFTHMQLGEIQNYLKQINRVLKQDGIASSTFFLYDDNNEDYIASKDSFNFPVKKEGFRLMSAKVKSANIAIHKATLAAMMQKENLEIVAVYDGFWKGTKNAEEYQDLVVYKRKK